MTRYRLASNQRYKMLLETLPSFLLIGIFALFLLTVFVFSLTSLLFNDAYSTKLMAAKYSGDSPSVLRGEAIVEGSIENMKRLNSEVLLWMQLTPNKKLNQMVGFTEDLRLEIRVFASSHLYSKEKSVTDEYVELTSNSSMVHERILTCNQGAPSCRPIVLFTEPFVRYKTYVVRVRFLNQGDQVDRNVFDPKINFWVNFVDEQYATLEISYRYAFLVLAFITLCSFLAYVRYRQQFLYWHTEQKWILTALVFLLFYNNPLYIAQFYSGSFVLVLVNIFFRVTFICLMMLAMLVFTHAMTTKPVDRNFSSFYLPKFVVVGCLWFVGSITYIFAEFKFINDPTYSVDNYPYYKVIVAAMLISISAFILMLLYHVARAVSVMLSSPTKYSNKFKVVWGMTLAILSSTIVVFFSVYAFGKITGTLFLITFQIMFNAYPMLLSLLFLPSKHRETIAEIHDDTQSFTSTQDEFTLGNEED